MLVAHAQELLQIREVTRWPCAAASSINIAVRCIWTVWRHSESLRFPWDSSGILSDRYLWLNRGYELWHPTLLDIECWLKFTNFFQTIDVCSAYWCKCGIVSEGMQYFQLRNTVLHVGNPCSTRCFWCFSPAGEFDHLHSTGDIAPLRQMNIATLFLVVTGLSMVHYYFLASFLEWAKHSTNW